MAKHKKYEQPVQQPVIIVPEAPKPEEPQWPYTLFKSMLATAILLGLGLPFVLKVPESLIERWIMAAMLPILLTIIWATRTKKAKENAVPKDETGTKAQEATEAKEANKL